MFYCRIKTLNNKSGYTLVEMIVVVTIMAFIGGVLFTIFSQGLNLWNRANTVRPGINVRFFVEKLTDDLRNAVSYESQALLGSKQAIEIRTLRKNRSQGEVFDSLQSIRYDFDVKRRSIILRTIGYPDLLMDNKKNVRESVVLEKIKNWNISYYTVDPENHTGSWRSSWLGECQPGAIKINIDFDETRSRKITTVIPMIAGTCS